MSYLTEAKAALVNAHSLAQDHAQEARYPGGYPTMSIEHNLLNAIAAALIANVEQRPKFFRYGTIALRHDFIVSISECDTDIYGGDRLALQVGDFGGRSYVFFDDVADAFLLWHEQHADVVRLDVPQEAE